MQNRFSIIFKEITTDPDNGYVTYVRILKDNLSGINYLMTSTGNSGGITPLLDSTGKIVNS